MGTLYVAATPIGNMEDITLRALRVLGQVGIVAAEDTRTTRKLLSHYGIRTPITSYHEHNKRTKTPYLLQVLQEKDVALVSEAGMPGISDPGYELISRAIDEKIRVVPLPGPSAVTAALVVSGLPTDGFLFLGFLPRRSGQRKRLIRSVVEEPRTLIIFEAPHRLVNALGDLLAVLGDRAIAVCRELTKLYEEIFRGTISKAIEYFVEPRGEFTLVIQGSGQEGVENSLKKKVEVDSLARQLRAEGLSTKEAVDEMIGLTAATRRQAYKAWIESKEK